MHLTCFNCHIPGPVDDTFIWLDVHIGYRLILLVFVSLVRSIYIYNEFMKTIKSEVYCQDRTQKATQSCVNCT